MIEDMGEFGTGMTPPPPPSEMPPAKSHSKSRGVAAGVGVALVVGAGGIAVASSGGTSTSGSPGAAPTTEGAPPPGPGAGHGPMGRFQVFGGPGLGVDGQVLHGTYVVAKSGGGYETIQTQTGTVDSVSSTSLAVKSKDGFSFTYVVKAGTVVDAERDGIGSVKKGDEVTVSATVSGKTATVSQVIDVTQLQKDLPNIRKGVEGGFGLFPGGPGGKFRGPRTAPSPTTSPGATT